jgi:hypothetical protein
MFLGYGQKCFHLVAVILKDRKEMGEGGGGGRGREMHKAESKQNSIKMPLSFNFPPLEMNHKSKHKREGSPALKQCQGLPVIVKMRKRALNIAVCGAG